MLKLELLYILEIALLLSILNVYTSVFWWETNLVVELKTVNEIFYLWDIVFLLRLLKKIYEIFITLSR